uniref:aminotransferase class I/II-fold pyridoxal phosphate-dependent enzyme n=1 Tax=Acetatifactor sp. TaxID=1872090 RepID=UPI0040566A1F
MSKKEEHLYDKLKEYAATDFYPYHMPGHKRRLNGEMPKEIMELDITEIEGFDNLHQPESILLDLQKKAAELYGAEESFYLVNGSSCGILAAISAALPEGGHLLMARNCHKSVYHAIYLRNLTVSYLYPSMIEAYDINDAITPAQVEEALERETDIGAVLLVSPTYEGRIADVEKIAQIVHERGIPLIVDEAHGAHLGWNNIVARNSCQAGADLVIHSVHKTLPAMTQTALLHVSGNWINRDKLRRFLHIYQSSSPSYVLMASIDNALHLMEKKGNELLRLFARQYHQMLDRLSECKCLEFLGTEHGRQDLGKLIISCKKAGLSGQQLYQIMLEEYHLQTEMAADSFCLAMFTVGDEPQAYERMTSALLDIDKRMMSGEWKPNFTSRIKYSSLSDGQGEALSLGEAWDRPKERVALHEAVGRYVGEFINLYPPGIPLLVPGERLTDTMYHQIISYFEQHLNLQGLEIFEENPCIQVLQE